MADNSASFAKIARFASSETQGQLASRVDKMFVVKVFCKIETSPWALTLTEPVPEAFQLPASDWPEKFFSGQSAKRSCPVTLVFSYTT